MAYKKTRSMKVYEKSDYRYRPIPMIRLCGKWLSEAGFSIGDYVSVSCEDGKIIITPDIERARLKEAEAVFMEREMKYLRKKFENEKKSFIFNLRQRRDYMFNTEELNSLDRKYFSVIAVNEYDVTVMRRNTGHYWYMHNPEYPELGTIILFRRHSENLPYHYQKREKRLRSAVRYIRKHDRFQMNGRKW